MNRDYEETLMCCKIKEKLISGESALMNSAAISGASQSC